VLPDLGLVLPVVPTGTPRATVAAIALTEVAVVMASAEAGAATPMAAVQTVSAGLNWEQGAAVGATVTSRIDPAIGWVAIVNPNHPAYGWEGGPLWAIAPIIVPVLPIIFIMMVAVLIKFILWVVRWIFAVVDIIMQILPF
jgi:hypothetical protein